MNFSDQKLPAWHDADGWMQFVAMLKTSSGVEGVVIQFETQHGRLTYETPDTDDEEKTPGDDPRVARVGGWA